MAVSILFAISGNFIEFEWDGKPLKWRGQSQNDIDVLELNPEIKMLEYAKKQVNDRLSGEAKAEFLKAFYEVKTVMELVGELDKLLIDTKKGK